MICSLRSVGGAIPDSTGRKAIGVGRRHPVIIHKTPTRISNHQISEHYQVFKILLGGSCP